MPPGLGLKIDKDDVGRMNFVRCLPNGCVAEVVIDDKLLDQMKNGQTMTFVIFQTPEEGIGVPLALAGFKEALRPIALSLVVEPHLAAATRSAISGRPGAWSDDRDRLSQTPARVSAALAAAASLCGAVRFAWTSSSPAR